MLNLRHLVAFCFCLVSVCQASQPSVPYLLLNSAVCGPKDHSIFEENGTFSGECSQVDDGCASFLHTLFVKYDPALNDNFFLHASKSLFSACNGSAADSQMISATERMNGFLESVLGILMARGSQNEAKELFKIYQGPSTAQPGNCSLLQYHLSLAKFPALLPELTVHCYNQMGDIFPNLTVQGIVTFFRYAPDEIIATVNRDCCQSIAKVERENMSGTNLFDIKIDGKTFLQRIGKMYRLHPDIIWEITTYERTRQLDTVLFGLNAKQLVSLPENFIPRMMSLLRSGNEEVVRYFEEQFRDLDSVAFYEAVTSTELDKERQEYFISAMTPILTMFPFKLIHDTPEFIMAFAPHLEENILPYLSPKNFLDERVVKNEKIQAILEKSFELEAKYPEADEHLSKFIQKFCGLFDKYLDIPMEYRDGAFSPFCLNQMEHPLADLQMSDFGAENFQIEGELRPYADRQYIVFRGKEMPEKFFNSISADALLMDETSFIKAFCAVFGKMAYLKPGQKVTLAGLPVGPECFEGIRNGYKPMAGIAPKKNPSRGGASQGKPSNLEISPATADGKILYKPRWIGAGSLPKDSDSEDEGYNLSEDEGNNDSEDEGNNDSEDESESTPFHSALPPEQFPRKRKTSPKMDDEIWQPVSDKITLNPKEFNSKNASRVKSLPDGLDTDLSGVIRLMNAIGSLEEDLPSYQPFIVALAENAGNLLGNATELSAASVVLLCQVKKGRMGLLIENSSENFKKSLASYFDQVPNIYGDLSVETLRIVSEQVGSRLAEAVVPEAPVAFLRKLMDGRILPNLKGASWNSSRTTTFLSAAEKNHLKIEFFVDSNKNRCNFNAVHFSSELLGKIADLFEDPQMKVCCEGIDLEAAKDLKKITAVCKKDVPKIMDQVDDFKRIEEQIKADPSSITLGALASYLNGSPNPCHGMSFRLKDVLMSSVTSLHRCIKEISDKERFFEDLGEKVKFLEPSCFVYIDKASLVAMGPKALPKLAFEQLQELPSGADEESHACAYLLAKENFEKLQQSLQESLPNLCSKKKSGSNSSTSLKSFLIYWVFFIYFLISIL